MLFYTAPFLTLQRKLGVVRCGLIPPHPLPSPFWSSISISEAFSSSTCACRSAPPLGLPPHPVAHLVLTTTLSEFSVSLFTARLALLEPAIEPGLVRLTAPRALPFCTYLKTAPSLVPGIRGGHGLVVCDLAHCTVHPLYNTPRVFDVVR